MWLLAQEVAIAPNWSNVLLAYGPLGVLAAFVVYFVYRYGTRMADGHIAFMETARKCMDQQSITLDTLTDSMVAHEHNCTKIPKMLGHMAEAAKLAVIGPTAPDIHRHLDRALDERDR